MNGSITHLNSTAVAIQLTIQNASKEKYQPTEQQMKQWIEAALATDTVPSVVNPEITVRIVEEEEAASLNYEWRQKHGPTNVLSFSYSHDDFSGNLLGDLVICAAVVKREAREQNKSLESHWAHMLVHGSLHLLGFDHVKDNEAEHMEQIETGILKNLGYANPYI